MSGSGQSLPVVPWIAVLDPDITTTAQEGLYVVYLYRSDLSRLYVSLNQGATQHLRNAEAAGLKGRAAEAAALLDLGNETTLLRGGLSPQATAGLLTKIDLDALGYFLPTAYERGNIAAMAYPVPQLPDEGVLRADLSQLLTLYSSCVEVKEEILTATPGLIKTSAHARGSQPEIKPKPPAFRPKDSTDYLAHVNAQSQVRQRRHESLLDTFANWVKGRGLVPANNVHPRDLTVEGRGQHWLVEAKTVGANAEHAVREAIGQLFGYRHFYYREQSLYDPLLVALFSDPIGQAFADLLVSLGIESIWRQGTEWRGCAPPGFPSLFEAALARRVTN